LAAFEGLYTFIQFVSGAKLVATSSLSERRNDGGGQKNPCVGLPLHPYLLDDGLRRAGKS